MIKTRAQFMRQFALGPPSPVRISLRAKLRPKLRDSAVLIPLVETDNGIEVIFTVRSDHLRHHAGQICFPGGRKDPHDPDLQATALRELDEELGIPPQAVDIVGQLPDMPVISQFNIRPFIGFITPPVQLQPDPAEVSDVFSVPLHQLLHHQLHYAYKIERFGLRNLWFIPWQHRMIWGATAAIVRSLAEQVHPQSRSLYRPLN